MTISGDALQLADLTLAQRAAAEWNDGALLVLAGPGSGKTRVLTSRIARILDQSRDGSFRILALTFTNRAADEMSARVVALVPGLEGRAFIGTFHSFCMNMLQQHGVHAGISPDFAIYSLDDDRQEVLREGLRRSDVDESWVRYLPAIDKLKGRLVSPAGCSNHFSDRAEGARIEQAYTIYEAELARVNALDFGSLIFGAYDLVTKFPGIAIQYRRAYRHWMFDEFQDTNDAQYRLMTALAGADFKNVFVVADDDQIIYQWNGASYRQLQRFGVDFKPTMVQLPTNYRCPPRIVAAANQLVVFNTQRTASKLPLEAGKTTAQLPEDQHIRLMSFATDAEEAAGVAADIARLGKERWGEVVVLGRTRALLEAMKAALQAAGVAAIVAQRRDDFVSAQMQWLVGVLRQALRPLDRRNFSALVAAFNRLASIDVQVDLVLSQAEGSARSFLEEWALAVAQVAGEASAGLAKAAFAFSQEPARFRTFAEATLAAFGAEPEASDLAEDRAAWNDLVRSIGQTIGRDAPLEQFLQELAIRSKDPPTTPSTVRLMTIHGAKGKEFDHVYVVGLAEEVLPGYQSVKAGDASTEMEEERRNCFVAITRTRECLTLSWAARYRGYAKQPSRFIQEMGLGQAVSQ